MNNSDTVYVDKRHYDALLRQFMCTKRELNELRQAWDQITQATTRFDDRVLEDIHRFDSLKEENAYIVGSFNTLLAMKYNIEELEGKRYVAPSSKQNQV